MSVCLLTCLLADDISLPVGQVKDSADDESGMEAALRTELCRLRVVRVDVVVRRPPRPQLHTCHSRRRHRYILDDDRSKYSRPWVSGVHGCGAFCTHHHHHRHV